MLLLYLKTKRGNCGGQQKASGLLWKNAACLVVCPSLKLQFYLKQEFFFFPSLGLESVPGILLAAFYFIYFLNCFGMGFDWRSKSLRLWTGSLKGAASSPGPWGKKLNQQEKEHENPPASSAVTEVQQVPTYFARAASGTFPFPETKPATILAFLAK